MPHTHAIVWMDSKEAHVFLVNREDVEKQRIKAHLPFHKIHHKAGVIGAGHVPLDHGYFDEIAKALEGAQEWILTGPGSAKDEMRSYLKTHHPELEKKLAGAEPSDHPSDGELLKHARVLFKAVDRMQPNSPPPPRD